MDYKKTKAPTNTVTRNIMDLCDDTNNIYESVAIIAKRANQISLVMTLWKRCSRIVSRLKSLAIMKNSLSQLSWLLRSL